MSGGESNHLLFGYETVFKTAVTANKVFGDSVSIRNVDLKNNIRRIFGLGNRDAVDFVAGRFEGALSIEFDLADPWFMRGVLGDITTSGSAPYVHTFTESNKPPSMTIENGISHGNTGSGLIRKYLGCIVGDCRISVATGDEPAKVSLTILYADETVTSGSISQTAATDYVYPFSYGDIQYPTGTTVANTESVELSITNTSSLKWALGSRKASRYDMRQRQYDITTVNFFDDPSEYLRKAYGGPGTATTPNTTMVSGEAGLRITLDNGGAGAQQRKWILHLYNSIIEHHGLPQSIENENMETIDIQAQAGLIQAFNNTATMP